MVVSLEYTVLRLYSLLTQVEYLCVFLGVLRRCHILDERFTSLDQSLFAVYTCTCVFCCNFQFFCISMPRIFRIKKSFIKHYCLRKSGLSFKLPGFSFYLHGPCVKSS